MSVGLDSVRVPAIPFVYEVSPQPTGRLLFQPDEEAKEKSATDR